MSTKTSTKIKTSTGNPTQTKRTHLLDFKAKSRDYVTKLFGGDTANLYADFPDTYDPLDLIENETSLDLVSLMSKSLDPVTGMPRDIRLPEGDFKEAKNYFDYCVNFVADDDKMPFARQMWAALHLLAEYCPRCSHPKWRSVTNLGVATDVMNIPNKVSLLEYGVCPRCKVTKAELIAKKEINLYTEAAWLWGQRAGKSTVTSSLSNYITHKLLKAPKLSSICEGIKVSTPLTATFVGLRFADAMATLWDPISKGFATSPWFIEYHEMLTDYGKRLGVEFFRFKDQYLRYEHKNLELYPAGPSKRALRGRTRFLTGLDELGWFPVGAENKDLERADADEVHDALDRSLLTVRNEVRKLYSKGFNSFLPGIAINISSPSDENDKICRLVEQNRTSPIVLALQLATWEVTPLFTKDNPEIADAYRRNSVNAERDYGAKPPANSRPFIDMALASKAFTGKNRATIQPVEGLVNERMRRAGKVTTNPAQPAPASVLAIDAGFSNNSFAAVVMHTRQYELLGSKFTEIRVPAIVEVQTRPGVVLHYTSIYKYILKPLMRDFNVRFMFADRWNSIALLDTAAEDFADKQLVSKQYSAKYVDFLLTRSYIEEGRMVLPTIEMPFEEIRRVESYPSYFEGKPSAHLLFQLSTVKDMGNTVIKGGPYTDDIFRALVLGTSRLLDPKISEALATFAAQQTRGPMLGAIVVGKASMMQSLSQNSFSGANNAHTAYAGNSLVKAYSQDKGYGQSGGQAPGSNSVVIRSSR